MPGHNLDIYLKALEKLEQLNLIRVIRNNETYRSWIITSPVAK